MADTADEVEGNPFVKGFWFVKVFI